MGARLYVSGVRGAPSSCRLRDRRTGLIERHAASKGRRAVRVKPYRLARGCSGRALDEVQRDGDDRDALWAKLGAALAEPDGLARGDSGGALDDEAPRNGTGRRGLRAKLGSASAEPDRLARGYSGGALDEAPHDGDGHDAPRAKL